MIAVRQLNSNLPKWLKVCLYFKIKIIMQKKYEYTSVSFTKKIQDYLSFFNH